MKQSPKTTHQTAMRSAGQPVRGLYPFVAIVGQEEMKLALILNVIDRSVGGVVMMGHRGTGKSTVVRALADLLPEITVLTGCAYSCDPTDEPGLCDECRKSISAKTKPGQQKRAVPVVELPLGATEDRVCGTIDLEQALGSGLKRFEPGLLARANRGFLYIDEVNLLEDHLVDLLLDVATTGVHKVERESISVEHPAKFVLIGSGNPEEGELRPQLLDRFGLYVEVRTEGEREHRMEIVERRDAFDRAPAAFRQTFADEQKQLRKGIVRAQKSLGNVKVERPVLSRIAHLCSDLKIDGHRGELTIMRAARALAAFEGRKQVADSDVKRVATMSLRHRLRRDTLEETASAERIEQALEKVLGNTGARGKDDGGSGGEGAGTELADRAPTQMPKQRSRSAAQSRTLPTNPRGGLGGDSRFSELSATAAEGRLPRFDFKRSLTKDRSAPSRLRGNRQTKLAKATYSRERGRYTRAVSTAKANSRIALDATVRALATADLLPSNCSGAGRNIVSSDALRFKLFKRKQGRLFIFAIDLSGSMALNRISQAKGTMLAVLRESYLKRDSVAIVGFGGTSAKVLLPPSRSILRARRVLESLRVGGGTPLSAGLAGALALAKRPQTQPGELILMLFTDGRANVPLRGNGNEDRAGRKSRIRSEVRSLGNDLITAGVRTILIDTQNQFKNDDSGRMLAHHLGAEYQGLLSHSHSLLPGGRNDPG